MQSIKKELSRDINYVIAKFNEKFSLHESRFHPEGDIPECRLQGENGSCHNSRFLGRQYSYRSNQNYIVPNLSWYFSKFNQKYKHINHSFPKFKWQKSFHDHIICNEKDYYAHYNYTIYNHIKHKLPRNWQYTSLNYVKDKEFTDIVWW